MFHNPINDEKSMAENQWRKISSGKSAAYRALVTGCRVKTCSKIPRVVVVWCDVTCCDAVHASAGGFVGQLMDLQVVVLHQLRLS